MSFLLMVRRSLAQHRLSSWLAVASIAAGVALLTAVISLREQTHRNFTQEGLGVDAILGPKGSPLQIVLCSLYHLEDMPGKIKWTYFQQVLDDDRIDGGIPFATGHSYAGFRVNAIDGAFFTGFTYLPGERFSFDPAMGGQGRAFAQKGEAVAGHEAARALGLRLGDAFNPVCGVNDGDPVHVNDHIVFVGVMAPTGTPHDRAIYIPLDDFYSLGGHGDDVARMAEQMEYREISGAYLNLRRVRGGALHPGLQGIKYEINQSTQAQLVIPAEELPRLFSIVGWVDRVVLAIALLVTALAGLFLFVSLVSALKERRRDLALLRCLGATRARVCGLVLAESCLMALAGTALGLLAGHGLVALGAHFIRSEIGLRFSASHISSADVWAMPFALAIGLVAGMLPARQAYRLGVLDNLTVTS